MTMPFHNLNDNSFFDAASSFPPDSQNVDTNPTGQYDNFIADNFNLNSDNLDLNLDVIDQCPNPPSRYITHAQFSDTLNNFNNDTFSLVHFNIRSLNKHFDELQRFLNLSTNQPPSIIGLSETWLNDKSHHPYSIVNYDFIFKNRQEKTGGGVALYVRNSYDYIIHESISLCTDYFESLFIELHMPNRKNIIIGIIYRPPNSNSRNFLDYLSELLDNDIFVNKDCFLLGDFNINLLNNDNVSLEFLETFMSASFLPLISKPTRHVTNSSTLIDNIFSNILPHPKSYIILSDITDHFPVLTYFTFSHPPKSIENQDLSRNISNENVLRLINSLQLVDWSDVLSSDDVDLSYDTFCKILNDNFDTFLVPRKSHSNDYKRCPRLPWISKALLRCINRKNNLYYRYKLEGNDHLKNKYISYKNTLTKLLRSAKRTYFSKRLESCKNDMKNTWKVIKEAMNSTNNKSTIDKIKSNDTLIDDPVSISNIFNSYFSQIGNNLASKIPQSNKNFTEFLGPANDNSIFLLPTNRMEILKIVSGLPNKKSSGHDNINYAIIKKIILPIANPLAHIFNLSLLQGRVPSSMKIAKVIPLFKRGDKYDVNNYRPISLLSSFSKILEKIVYKRTLSFINHNNIFSDVQFGFRERHSTVHALLTFIDKAAHSIDNSSHMIGIFLDFSKAFDTINHDILLSKLSHYGVRGKALEWFRSYLSNRKQYVSLNNNVSSFCDINCGVPQGSILGPLLFLIYINDFCKCSTILSFIHFADDTNLFYSHRNSHTLVDIVNRELVHVSHWIRSNKLSINIQKTKYIIFSNTLESLPLDIILDDNPLEKVSTTKFLGIIVDNKLSWKPHIDAVCSTISRNVGIINRLKTQLPLKPLLMLYSTLISPYLYNGILVWGNANQCLLERILLLQKKALRVISMSPPRAHSKPLFFEYKLLQVQDLFNFQLGQLMFNFNNKMLPSIFNNIFLKNNSIHSYPTRQANEFHLPLLRTSSAQRTFIYEGPKYWYSINPDIKSSPSLCVFKEKLLSHLLQSYEQPES